MTGIAMNCSPCPQPSQDPSSGQTLLNWCLHLILTGPAQLWLYSRVQRDFSERQRIDHVIKQLKNLPRLLCSSLGKTIKLHPCFFFFNASSSASFFSQVSHYFCKNSFAPVMLNTCSFSYFPCSVHTKVHLPRILCPHPLHQVNCICACYVCEDSHASSLWHGSYSVLRVYLICSHVLSSLDCELLEGRGFGIFHSCL